MDTHPFKHLHVGQSYAVVREFKDYDGQVHPVGERWTYNGQAFLPYDDGQSLFVTIDGRERHIRMQWRDEEQGPILDSLHEYVEAA